MECSLKEKRDIGVNYVTHSDGLMDSLLKSKDKHKKLARDYQGKRVNPPYRSSN